MPRLSGLRRHVRAIPLPALNVSELPAAPRRVLFLPRRDHRPVVRAERRGREAGGVVEAYGGVIGPAVADGGRLLDLRGPDDDVFAVDLRVRPDEFFVRAGDLEALGG